MVKHESIYDEIVKIQRTSNRDQSYLEVYNMDREVPLLSVRFELLEDAAIEDYCGKAIMIDFANKKLGGGVLKNGCVQEEILFAIFPELIVTKLIC
jgi:poly(ADP-ribose) glycohydrolase